MIVISDFSFSGDFDFDKMYNIEWIDIQTMQQLVVRVEEQFQTTAIKQFCFVLTTLQLG